jgi:hypothetical protein
VWFVVLFGNAFELFKHLELRFSSNTTPRYLRTILPVDQHYLT